MKMRFTYEAEIPEEHVERVLAEWDSLVVNFYIPLSKDPKVDMTVTAHPVGAEAAAVIQ